MYKDTLFDRRGNPRKVADVGKQDLSCIVSPSRQTDGTTTNLNDTRTIEDQKRSFRK